MRLPPWLLSFVSPLCTTPGSFAVPAPGLVHPLRHSALITARFQALPPGPTAALYARSLQDHDEARVTLTQLKPIATAVQQKVSD